MSLRTKLTATATLLALAAPAVHAFAADKKKPKNNSFSDMHKPTPEQNALIDKSIAREAVVIKLLKERAPLVETYIQNMKPDPVMGQAPASDWHSLGRVDFGKVIGDQSYGQGVDRDKKKGFFGSLKGSLGYITGLSASLHLQYHEAGFISMLLVDSNSYNRQTYQFQFVRNDFLGTVKTMVVDVAPVKKNAEGRFIGRIWIETGSGNIVRFNGDFAGSDSENIKKFYHFDSWRTNLQEGMWLPTSVYIEESDPNSPTHSLEFKAINNIWGYALKVPQGDVTNTDVQILGDAQDQSAQAQAQDMTPLQAQRQWVQQAEDNVIDRLFKAGLIDAPSDFDKLLETLANNILAYNNIPIDRAIKVRTLMTAPLESLAVGNTILLSKGLIDTTAVPTQDGAQQMGNLNALLAFQIAHILLGHHIDTKYAFNDRLLFPDSAAFEHLPMQHTDEDDAAAAKKAIELLSVKDLADGQQYFGLYLQQLAVRAKGLKALNTPQLGDSLIKSDGTFWMQPLVGKAPKLNNTDLKQQAAMPLGQFLKFDPWTDQVIRLSVASYAPLLGAPDKLPFEITPIYIKLTPWQPGGGTAAALAAPGAPATPNTPNTPAGATQAAPAQQTAPATQTAPAPQQ